MNFKIFILLILQIQCYNLNKTQAEIGRDIRDDGALEALIDHECRECAHDFNDGVVEKGRMVTVLPVIHPVYKISIEAGFQIDAYLMALSANQIEALGNLANHKMM